MSERLPGDFGRADIDAGFRALAAAQGTEHLGSLIDSTPVLRSPIFHAQLRTYLYASWKDFQTMPEAFERFMAVYDDYFTLLHYRAYASQRPSEHGEDSARGAVEPFAPELFLALLRRLGDDVPATSGPRFDPVADHARMVEEVV
jgi:hypothetical protein